MASNGTVAMLNATMQKVEKLERGLVVVQERLDDIQGTLSVFLPRKPKRFIRKPVVGKDCTRKFHVTKFIWKEVNKMNDATLQGQEMLEQFPEERELKDVHTGALSIVSLVLSKYLADDFGEIKYKTLFHKSPKIYARVMNVLRADPELSVYTQASGQWAIDHLIKLALHNRMKAVKRKNADTADDSDSGMELDLQKSNQESSQ